MVSQQMRNARFSRAHFTKHVKARSAVLFLLALFFWAIYFLPWRRHAHRTTPGIGASVSDVSNRASERQQNGRSSCNGRRVFMYELPPNFNSFFEDNCDTCCRLRHFCRDFENDGLGPSSMQAAGPGQKQDLPLSDRFFVTEQHMLDVIFHKRIMKSYKCRELDPERADLFFIPAYAATHYKAFQRNMSTAEAQDAFPKKLRKLLRASPFFERHGGKDHFMVLGRGAWEIQIQEGHQVRRPMFIDWRVVSNMTFLTVESSSFDSSFTSKEFCVEPTPGLHGRQHEEAALSHCSKPFLRHVRSSKYLGTSNQLSVPYPTSLHPKTASEVQQWLGFVEKSERPFLFSFGGRPRQDGGAWKLRGLLWRQCNETSSCLIVDCRRFACEENPMLPFQGFLKSKFCLQPPGDSLSRRSIFDALISGCIPVMFDRRSFHEQYFWHLPRDRTTMSLFLQVDAEAEPTLRIERVLNNIPQSHVQKMQKTIFSLIPKLLYADKRSYQDDTFVDAFDVAIAALSQLSKAKIALG